MKLAGKTFLFIWVVKFIFNPLPCPLPVHRTGRGRIKPGCARQMEVAFRLPWMGDPYGGPCGGGFGAAGGQHVQAPPPASAEWRSSAGSAGPTWGPTTNPRKRGWDEHGSAADERSVRLCALSNFCGGGSVVGGAGPSPAQLSGQKPGHGAWPTRLFVSDTSSRHVQRSAKSVLPRRESASARCRHKLTPCAPLTLYCKSLAPLPTGAQPCLRLKRQKRAKVQ